MANLSLAFRIGKPSEPGSAFPKLTSVVTGHLEKHITDDLLVLVNTGSAIHLFEFIEEKLGKKGLPKGSPDLYEVCEDLWLMLTDPKGRFKLTPGTPVSNAPTHNAATTATTPAIAPQTGVQKLQIVQQKNIADLIKLPGQLAKEFIIIATGNGTPTTDATVEEAFQISFNVFRQAKVFALIRKDEYDITTTLEAVKRWQANPNNYNLRILKGVRLVDAESVGGEKALKDLICCYNPGPRLSPKILPAGQDELLLDWTVIDLELVKMVVWNIRENGVKPYQSETDISNLYDMLTDNKLNSLWRARKEAYDEACEKDEDLSGSIKVRFNVGSGGNQGTRSGFNEPAATTTGGAGDYQLDPTTGSVNGIPVYEKGDATWERYWPLSELGSATFTSNGAGKCYELRSLSNRNVILAYLVVPTVQSTSGGYDLHNSQASATMSQHAKLMTPKEFGQAAWDIAGGNSLFALSSAADWIKENLDKVDWKYPSDKSDVLLWSSNFARDHKGKAMLSAERYSMSCSQFQANILELIK